MDDSAAIDRAIRMRRQVHSRDHILREYPSDSGAHWHVLGLDERREPRLDLLERLGDRHQRAVMSKTIVA
jgi:hypothetical protein